MRGILPYSNAFAGEEDHLRDVKFAKLHPLNEGVPFITIIRDSGTIHVLGVANVHRAVDADTNRDTAALMRLGRKLETFIRKRIWAWLQRITSQKSRLFHFMYSFLGTNLQDKPAGINKIH